MAGDLKRLYPVRVAPISLQTKKFRHAPTHTQKYTLTQIPVCTHSFMHTGTDNNIGYISNIQISAYKKAHTHQHTRTCMHTHFHQQTERLRKGEEREKNNSGPT